MAKAKIRTASVDDEMAGLIDVAARMDKQSKEIESQLKTAKNKIKESAPLEDEETSVRMEGKEHKAVVTRKTSFSVDADNLSDGFRAAFKDGKLSDVIRASVSVAVTPDRLDQLKALLSGNGYSHSEEFTVDGKALDKMEEDGATADVLASALKAKQTLAVKFE